MRQIGTLSNAKDAAKLSAYLIAQGIPAQTEEVAGQWALWVRDEDHLPTARIALSEFQADPEDSKFHGVEQIAEQRRREEAAKRDAAKQNVVVMGQRWHQRTGGRRRPLTLVILFVCGAIGVMTNMGEDSSSRLLNQLRFCDMGNLESGWKPVTVADKLIDVRRGQIWRILTPIFVHYGALHLAFNLVMFYQTASMIEHRRGSAQLALLILAIAVPSNLAQALIPNELGGAAFFGGMSGVVFGLLGYLWMKSRFDPATGFFISRGTMFSAIVFLVLGIAGAFNSDEMRIANWAHSVGFLSGIVIGYAPLLWRSRAKE